MNKMWVWVGFPLGISVLLLLIVFMGEAGAEGIKYKDVMTEAGTVEKIGYVDKKPGAGAVVKMGSMATLSFTAKFGGQTIPSKKPEPWFVGQGKFGRGFDEGLVGMKEGGVREIIVPPQLMKGGPAGDIVFEVQVFEVRDMPPGHGPMDGGEGQ